MHQFGNFTFDTGNECLWCGRAQIALQPKPFAVLRYLVENPGRLVTHGELMDAIWRGTFVQQQILRTYILELRRVLGDDASQPQFIQTLPKRGYCFIAPVTEMAETARSAHSEAAELLERALRVVERHNYATEEADGIRAALDKVRAAATHELANAKSFTFS